MDKRQSTFWLLYGFLLIALGSFYIYDELKKRAPGRCQECQEKTEASIQEDEDV